MILQDGLGCLRVTSNHWGDLWEGMGLPVNQIRTSCPWGDRQYNARERRGPTRCPASLLGCPDGPFQPFSRRKATAPWSWEAGGVSLPDSRARVGLQRGSWLVGEEPWRRSGAPGSGPESLLAGTLPLVFLPDSWVCKHLPRLGQKALETCHAFITDGKCYSWRLWCRSKPSVSSFLGDSVAVHLWRMPSPLQPVWGTPPRFGRQAVPPQHTSGCVLAPEGFRALALAVLSTACRSPGTLSLLWFFLGSSWWKNPADNGHKGLGALCTQCPGCRSPWGLQGLRQAHSGNGCNENALRK